MSDVLQRVQSEAEIPTPALIVDVEVARRNIESMAAYANEHGLKLRPHTKTHKSKRIARMQVDAGAAGLTVAKLGEARVMAEVDSDILIAYPALDPHRAAGIAELAKHKQVRVAVDSVQACESLADAAASAGSTIGILADVDVGFHRTGVQTAEQAAAIGLRAAELTGLRADGLFCFPGHIHGDEPDALALADRILQDAIAAWRDKSLEVSIVSGGSTPTARFCHKVTSLTEMRPGTYVYNDWNCASADWCDGLDACAATVVATVVSNAVPGKVVVDAGNKTLTSDRHWREPDTQGHGQVLEYPGAKLVRLSEEHGEMDLSQTQSTPKLGERVHILPNHICPCVNLQSSVWYKLADGTFEQESVDARGLLV